MRVDFLQGAFFGHSGMWFRIAEEEEEVVCVLEHPSTCLVQRDSLPVFVYGSLREGERSVLSFSCFFLLCRTQQPSLHALQQEAWNRNNVAQILSHYRSMAVFT